MRVCIISPYKGLFSVPKTLDRHSPLRPVCCLRDQTTAASSHFLCAAVLCDSLLRVRTFQCTCSPIGESPLIISMSTFAFIGCVLCPNGQLAASVPTVIKHAPFSTWNKHAWTQKHTERRLQLNKLVTAGRVCIGSGRKTLWRNLRSHLSLQKFMLGASDSNSLHLEDNNLTHTHKNK